MEKKRAVTTKKAAPKAAPKTSRSEAPKGITSAAPPPAERMSPGRRVAVFFSQDGDGPFVLLHETGIPPEYLGTSNLPLTLGAEGEATHSMVRVKTLVDWYRGRIYAERRITGKKGVEPGDPIAEWQGNLQFFENLLAHHPPRKRESNN